MSTSSISFMFISLISNSVDWNHELIKKKEKGQPEDEESGENQLGKANSSAQRNVQVK